MAVTAKPFSYPESVRRSIFKGRPSVFSAEDLNRQFDALTYFADKISAGLGLIRENMTVSITVMGGSALPVPAWTGAIPNVLQMAFTVTVAPVDAGRDMYIYSKGVAIKVDAEVITTTLEYTSLDLACVYLYLLAKRVTVTFADDAVMSGINSTEFPTSISSSDTILFEEPRLMIASIDDPVTIQSGEEVIGIIWSYIGDTVKTGYDTTTKTYEQVYNAFDGASLILEYPFYDETEDLDTQFASNGSLVEVLLSANKNLMKRIEAIEQRFNSFDHIPSSISGTSLNTYLSLDSAFVVMPFLNGPTSILTTRRLLSALEINFFFACSYNQPATPSPACFYILIPHNYVVRTGINYHGLCSVWALASASPDAHVQSFCTVEAVGGTGYIKITPLVTFNVTPNPDTISTSPVNWLGITAGGDEQSCIIKGQLLIDITPPI